MADKRIVSLGILLTAVTSRLMAKNLGEFQEFCEWFLGHPIWTHEYADTALWSRLKKGVIEQHQDLDIDLIYVKEDNFSTALADLERVYGGGREIEQRPEPRDEDPISSLERVMHEANLTQRIDGEAPAV